MRMRRRNHPSKDAVEQLLDGGRTTPPALPTVARLLSAAAPEQPAPGSPVTGEAEALALFRSARSSTTVAPVRRGRLIAVRAAVVATLSTKLALGAFAAVAAGAGVVAIASTGVLPGTDTDREPAPRPPASSYAPSTDPATPRPGDLPTPGPATPGGRPTDLPTPGPATPSGRPTDLPTPAPGEPSRRPSDLPTPRPAPPGGKPTDLPTPGHATPSSKPTDLPTSRR